ncbi:MAG TPA: glycosyltransferase family 2 protein [Phycisphaerae bacterium]|nr:glycosyltransferase family 2 protein [Phycisphaerae bacterium]HRR83410.1 glycosyltransferase family 2 protein [Phycisphaerae bacterium]
MGSRLISIVVPVYDEVDSLDGLVAEIRDVAARNDLEVEVILVDDGSRDASWERIVSLARNDKRIGGLRFRRNCGKAAALMAGFAVARGNLVFMMDADMQDPPEEMPRMLAKLDEGFDLVSGWKRIRHDPWHKVYPSRVFNKMIGWLTGVRLHDHVCGFKVMRREVAKDLRLYGEFHRFIAVFSAARGYRVTEIPTLHRARTRGVGKYGLTRFFKGFLDLLTVTTLTRYRWRPQHVIGVTGVVVVLLGAMLPLLAVIAGQMSSELGRLNEWLGRPFETIRGLTAMLAWLLLVLTPGLVLIAIGLVAELVVAERPLDRLYEVVEKVGWCAETEPAQG